MAATTEQFADDLLAGRRTGDRFRLRSTGQLCAVLGARPVNGGVAVDIEILDEAFPEGRAPLERMDTNVADLLEISK